MRKGIRRTTNLWIGESAYASAWRVGSRWNLTPCGLSPILFFVGHFPHFSSALSWVLANTLIETIHVKPITFIL